MAISDSRRSIEVPKRTIAPSADTRRPVPGAVTNALNGPARPPLGGHERFAEPIDEAVP